MRWKKNWYLAHRWLGLLVSVQLLAWSIGGFAFSILDIKDVRGELDTQRQEDEAIDFAQVQLSPADAFVRASAHGIESSSVAATTLKRQSGRMVYKLVGEDEQPLALVNAVTGEVGLRISEAEACAAALADFAHDTSVEAVSLLEGTPPLEFRGGRTPVYKVILDHPKHPHIYVCPVTGEVLKRRNELWRIFDFFWMLHIMDYGEREDFNHWLLTAMSLLAITTSASGLILWWWRRPWRIKGG